MKKQIAVLVAIFVIALVVFVNAPTASAGNWQDPQLCVNGKLLAVLPDVVVYVQVPEGTQVSDKVDTCGGDTSQPVIDLRNVTVNPNLNGQMDVSTQNVAKNVKVMFSYNGVTQWDQAKKDGVAEVMFRLP